MGRERDSYVPTLEEAEILNRLNNYSKRNPRQSMAGQHLHNHLLTSTDLVERAGGLLEGLIERDYVHAEDIGGPTGWYEKLYGIQRSGRKALERFFIENPEYAPRQKKTKPKSGIFSRKWRDRTNLTGF